MTAPQVAEGRPADGRDANGAPGAPPTGHRHFHDELETLKQRLLDMAERAETLIELAVNALLQEDEGLAQAVVANDEELDALEIEVEQLAISMLALQQPLARDLRFVIGAIKISSDLERVGDHAVNIAQSTLRLAAARSGLLPPPEVTDMAERAREMLSDALTAFVRRDGQLGRAVCARDDEVDSLHESMFRILVTHMMGDPRTINAALEYLLVSRNLERVADLATNIGEDAVYYAEGKQIKHHFEEQQGARAAARRIRSDRSSILQRRPADRPAALDPSRARPSAGRSWTPRRARRARNRRGSKTAPAPRRK